MHNAGDLRTLQRPTGVNRQQYRCGRLLLLTEESVGAGQREMHPCARHRRQGGDRANQFAFQATLVVESFLELGRTEFLSLDKLESDRAAFWQSLRRQTQAGVMDLVGRNHDDATAFGELVRDVHLRERRDHRAAVPVGQVREKHAIVRGTGPHHRRRNDRRHRGRAERQHQLVAHWQSAKGGL